MTDGARLMDRLHAADHEERVRILQESDHPAARQLRTEARERGRKQERERILGILELRDNLTRSAARYVTERALDDDQPTQSEVLRELVELDHLKGADNG